MDRKSDSGNAIKQTHEKIDTLRNRQTKTEKMTDGPKNSTQYIEKQTDGEKKTEVNA